MLAFHPFGVPEVYRVMPLSVAMVVSGVKGKPAEAHTVESVDVQLLSPSSSLVDATAATVLADKQHAKPESSTKVRALCRS